MAVTLEMIAALNAQIALPERQITNGNESVTYRSIADLIAARDALQAEYDNAQAAAAGVGRRRQTYAYYGGRGFGNPGGGGGSIF